MADTDTQKDIQEKEDADVVSDDLTDGQDLAERLQAELEEAKRQQQDSLAQAQRTLADYSNLKRRFEKEREELTAFATEMLLMRLLPAIDNLDRAVMFATDGDKKTTIFTGVTMTLQQIHDVMGKVGLQQIEVKMGDTFDPHIHEAVESVEGAADTVVEVLDAGYRLHDKVVRPARVKVGKG